MRDGKKDGVAQIRLKKEALERLVDERGHSRACVLASQGDSDPRLRRLTHLERDRPLVAAELLKWDGVAKRATPI